MGQEHEYIDHLLESGYHLNPKALAEIQHHKQIGDFLESEHERIKEFLKRLNSPEKEAKYIENYIENGEENTHWIRCWFIDNLRRREYEIFLKKESDPPHESIKDASHKFAILNPYASFKEEINKEIDEAGGLLSYYKKRKSEFKLPMEIEAKTGYFLEESFYYALFLDRLARLHDEALLRIDEAGGRSDPGEYTPEISGVDENMASPLSEISWIDDGEKAFIEKLDNLKELSRLGDGCHCIKASSKASAHRFAISLIVWAEEQELLNSLKIYKKNGQEDREWRHILKLFKYRINNSISQFEPKLLSKYYRENLDDGEFDCREFKCVNQPRKAK